MKPVLILSVALALSSFGLGGWAAQHDQHPGHHPAGAASGPKINAGPGKTAADMAKMDSQTKAMRDMHDKMMAAQTPESRNALMAEHMKTMQDGMSMMNGMSSGMSGGMKSDAKAMKGDTTMQHQTMEKRMEMMQAMMQMMMDRLPAAPVK